jgi:hypothetical protein
MAWGRAFRQLTGISQRWETISQRIGAKAREEMQRLLLEALAVSGTALLEVINRLMQLGLSSDAADIFREIGRASREILDTERRSAGGQPPRGPQGGPTAAAPPPAATAATVDDVKNAVESLLASVAPDPASYPNFKFEDVDRNYELLLHEGFISGYSYRLTVGVGMCPDRRFGGPGEQPKSQRDSSPAVIPLRVALFQRGGAIRIEGNPLDTLEWPASGPSVRNAVFGLKALPLSEPGLGLLHLYFYHELNLVYTAGVKIAVKPDGSEWSEDERPISWVFREDKDANRSQLFHHFAAVPRLSPRAANLAIQRGEGKDEYLLTAFIGRAEIPARVVLTRDEIDSQVLRVRSRLDRLRRSRVYLEGGYSEAGEYLGDFKGSTARFSRARERLPAKDAMNEWKSFITDMATLGSEFYDKLFRTKSGQILRQALEENLQEGDAIQVWIDSDAVEFVYPWVWLYAEPVNPSRRFVLKNERFWGYRYVIEQVARFPEVIFGEPRIAPSGACLSAEVGIWNFVPTTSAQREYFAKVAKKNAGRFQYRISGDPETFLGVCTSRIVYFFSHGHTAKLASTASLTSYDMGQAWKEWLEKPQDTDSAWMREYRTRALSDLERLQSDVNAFSETHILLQNGKLLLRELETRFDLQSDALVFLNMCESAQVFSSLTGGLIDGFLKKGARGVIGAEIPMVDSFADLFSRELFDRLLFGSTDAGPESLGAALRALRCKYLDMNNPLAFAYTYFGDTSAKFGLSKPGEETAIS